jgi:hypothetical protein
MSDTQLASITQPHTASDAPPIHEQVARAFRDQMQTLAPHRNPHEVFRAFVEMAALTIHQSPYHLGFLERDDAFDRIERAYLGAIQPYSRDELQRLVQLYGLAVLAFSALPATDLLGRVFMELDIGNQHVGQYFTPPPVARAMATMMVHDARPLIERKGVVTVAEPACGSGCLIIEMANELYELGYDPKQVLKVHATDISRDGFNMAYVQLSLLNIPIVVVHGDTLRLEVWESRPTPMLALMTQRHGIPTDGAPTPPAPESMAIPIDNPPDIRMPGAQLGFHFERHPKGV